VTITLHSLLFHLVSKQTVRGIRLNYAICLTIVVVCVSPLSVQSQRILHDPKAEVSTTVTRDQQAISTVQLAIAAMGGEAAWKQVRNVTVTAEASSENGVTQQRWIDDLSKPFPEFRREVTRSGSTSAWASGHGNGAANDGTKARAIPMHVTLASLPYHLPASILIRELADEKYSFEWAGEEDYQGTPVLHVTCSRHDDLVAATIAVQEWYFDAKTYLPKKVQYRVPSLSNAVLFHIANLEYADYRSQEELVFPFTLVHAPALQHPHTVTVRSVLVNSPISAADFEIAGGAQ
jgi:hypothetical protein